MEIIVTGKQIEVTDAIRSYAEDKAGKFPKYFDRVTEISVLLDKQDNIHYTVEVIAKAEHTDPFVASSSHEDLYAAIDDVTNKIERQLSDHKEKLRNRKHIKQ